MQLVGEWYLVTWESRTADGDVLRPAGDHPNGDLIYTSSGRMSGQIADERRPLLGTTDPRGGSASERAAAFSSYIAYGGTYETDGEHVIHHVEFSAQPDWVGTDQLRRISFEPNGDLVLSTMPMSIDGRLVENRLTWRRRSS
jgi:hypothetical protein